MLPKVDHGAVMDRVDLSADPRQHHVYLLTRDKTSKLESWSTRMGLFLSTLFWFFKAAVNFAWVRIFQKFFVTCFFYLNQLINFRNLTGTISTNLGEHSQRIREIENKYTLPLLRQHPAWLQQM